MLEQINYVFYLLFEKINSPHYTARAAMSSIDENIISLKIAELDEQL